MLVTGERRVGENGLWYSIVWIGGIIDSIGGASVNFPEAPLVECMADDGTIKVFAVRVIVMVRTPAVNDRTADGKSYGSVWTR